jgi:hypothetical protein
MKQWRRPAPQAAAYPDELALTTLFAGLLVCGFGLQGRASAQNQAASETCGYKTMPMGNTGAGNYAAIPKMYSDEPHLTNRVGLRQPPNLAFADHARMS